MTKNMTLEQMARVWRGFSKEFDLGDMVDEGVQSVRREQKRVRLQELEDESLKLKQLRGIHYFYSPKDEVSLEHNIFNEFKSSMEKMKERESRYEHDERSKNATQFTETTEGIFVKKGAEMGMFNFGSTVVIIFSAPKDLKFNLTVGQKVRMGETVFPQPAPVSAQPTPVAAAAPAAPTK